MNNRENENCLYRGVFWIVDAERLERNDNYVIRILTDKKGNALDSNYPLNSKKGDDYNHKLTWELLPVYLKGRRAYNYYPRGRVQIKNGKCSIYINPLLNTEAILNYVIKQFNLHTLREEGNLRIIVDYSEHYQARRN